MLISTNIEGEICFVLKNKYIYKIVVIVLFVCSHYKIIQFENKCIEFDLSMTLDFHIEDTML